MAGAAFQRSLPALVLLIAVAAVIVLALNGSAPFGAPPPASQTNSGVAPVLARALWSVVPGRDFWIRQLRKPERLRTRAALREWSSLPDP